MLSLFCIRKLVFAELVVAVSSTEEEEVRSLSLTANISTGALPSEKWLESRTRFAYQMKNHQRCHQKGGLVRELARPVNKQSPALHHQH